MPQSAYASQLQHFGALRQVSQHCHHRMCEGHRVGTPRAAPSALCKQLMSTPKSSPSSGNPPLTCVALTWEQGRAAWCLTQLLSQQCPLIIYF